MRKSSYATAERIEDAAMPDDTDELTEIKKKKTGCSL